jgi:hypothetical protein
VDVVENLDSTVANCCAQLAAIVIAELDQSGNDLSVFSPSIDAYLQLFGTTDEDYTSYVFTPAGFAVLMRIFCAVSCPTMVKSVLRALVASLDRSEPISVPGLGDAIVSKCVFFGLHFLSLVSPEGMGNVFDILSREGRDKGYTFFSPAFGEFLLHCISAGDLSVVSSVGWFLVPVPRDPCLSSETLQSIAELVWLIVGRIHECAGISASVDLLLALFDGYPLPTDNDLSQMVFAVFRDFTITGLADVSKELVGISDEDAVLQALKLFRFMLHHSLCLPSFGDGLPLKKVYLLSGYEDERFDVRHLAQTLFFEILIHGFVDLTAVLEAEHVMALVYGTFCLMSCGSTGDRESIALVLQGMITVVESYGATCLSSPDLDMAGVMERWTEVTDDLHDEPILDLMTQLTLLLDGVL